MANRPEPGPDDGLRRASDGAPRFTDPDPFQLVWMEELRELLRGPDIDLAVPQHVDRLFVGWCSRWHATPPAERWDPLPSLSALGVAVGDLVRTRRPDLRWRVVAGCRPTTLVLTDAADRAVASPVTDIATWWMSRDLTGIPRFLARLLGAPAVAPAGAAAPAVPHAPHGAARRSRARSVA